MSESNRSETGSSPPSGSRSVVWILDDSPMEAAMARRALSPTYDAVTFTDGTVLIEQLAGGGRPSALVLDWQLPGMSGIEVCRFLRSTRSELELPILMLTVYGHRTDLVEGLGAGANDYLTKPYDPVELVARVGNLARLHALHVRARLAEGQRAELHRREREARAEAEAANIAKDDFVAMVSHELRTPLNAILGWTRLVRGGKLPAEQKERALDTIERNAIAQAQLIDDLLDMSTILSRKLTIDHQSLDLAGVVRTAVDAIRPAAQAKEVTLDVRVPETVCNVIGDAPRLQQVIWNLLTNSIKFTPKGGEVTLEVVHDEMGTEIRVKDTGSGIDPEFLPRVFDRFRQADGGSRRAQGGLGLGLAIVKHIVKLHGGAVLAKSPGVGLGSTFTVWLPPAEESSLVLRPPGVSRSKMIDLPTNRLQGLRVLAFDDDADALDLLETILREAGAVVSGASSSQRGVELLVQLRPDVIVSDIGMPLRDGYDLIRDIRALPELEGGRTPALALTAFAAKGDHTRALEAGFDRYATKPFDVAELVITIAELGGRGTPSRR
jgi:signal transduction histidine kinase